MKKVMSLLIALAVLFAPQVGFAQTVANIGASGTLSSVDSVLRIEGGSNLDFSPSGDSLIAQPGALTVRFADNQAGYQGIIVSTDNGTRTENGQDVLVGAGLVGQTDEKEVVGLRWQVFKQAADVTVDYEEKDETEHNDWVVKGYSNFDFTTFVYPAGTTWTDGDGVVHQIGGDMASAYVSDKGETGFSSSYATILGGINGASESTATGEITQYVPEKPNVDLEAAENADLKAAITAENGTLYLKFMADFTGKSAQTYSTQTLKLELVTLD